MILKPQAVIAETCSKNEETTVFSNNKFGPCVGVAFLWMSGMSSFGSKRGL